jgi:multidrug efflux pump subunit AcrB
MPKTDERKFVLSVSLHPDTPLEITNGVIKRIEKAISNMMKLKIYRQASVQPEKK